MTDYYLINDHIKFYFDIENQCIEYQGESTSLEPKETKILKYILEQNKDGLIKSETILDDNWAHWSDKKVLQKVLSTLRKKFKQIGVKENGFIAAGTDYKINYQGVLVTQDQEKLKRGNALKSRITKTIQTAAIWASVVAISMYAYQKFNEKPHFTVDNIIQATAISGVSLGPALSPDGKALAFHHLKDNLSSIYLKVDTHLSYQILTENHKDQVAAWSPSGRQLAFQRLEGGICEIRSLTLDENYNKVGPSKKLTDCSTYSYISSIAWETEETLFFTDSKYDREPYEIKHLNITNGKTSNVLTYNEATEPTKKRGPGHYYLVYNQKLKSLFSLESTDWTTTNINRFDSNNKPRLIQKVGVTLLSIDIYNNHVIFKDLDNQLKSFALDEPKNIITIYKNPLKPISHPTVSADSNKIAIMSGSVFQDTMFALNLEDDTSTEVISSQFRLRVPQQVDKVVYFVSDETGISQIYAFHNNRRLQLTNFNKNKTIVYYTVSTDQKWLAINFVDKTVIYHYSADELVEAKSFELMTFPAFSQNSERLLLTNLQQSDSTEGKVWVRNLVEYNLENFTETGITIKKAKFGVYHNKGIIFAGANGGIKLFKLNGIETLNDSLSTLSPSLLTVNSKFLFVSKSYQTYRIDLQSKAVVELPTQIYGAISASNTHLYYNIKKYSKMVIFRGDLVSN
ncbi:MAG: PD40 domain-containing protein [Algicola sp.]|nr:PD40 domain-containing protein [Algicola sp.]